MEKSFLFILILAFAFGCKKKKDVNVETVLKNYSNSLSELKKAEYKIQQIDTFTSGNVWNNKGQAIIEREKTDSLFGFYFFGERYDIKKQYIYDGNNEFRIDIEKKNFKIREPGIGFLGSPGGQMISKNLIFPDTIYKSVQLTEHQTSYELKYLYEDNPTLQVINHYKIIELDKKTFIPKKITNSYERLGEKASQTSIITDLKINSDVLKTIEEIKIKLQDFEIVVNKPDTGNHLIGMELPKLKLANLFDQEKLIFINKGKIVLLDFWEVWCSPCIKSLPEVEKINEKYGDKIDVFGIVTDNIEKAEDFARLKQLSFINLIGNKVFKKELKVRGVPKYFLIDKEGFIRKEYIGFSTEIQKDIELMIAE